MNRLRSLIQEVLAAAHGTSATRLDMAYWISWKGIGLLAAAVLLPFGWILPVARLARAWAAARRGPN
jgi:lauroyl/myristoyl acyltransferase